ncbi:MAG TPA: MlaD family protein [Anaeromyxobacteraceae bacterium]|nr:MlaD family protein [Anaeromyxobacteraceae bacterium]
MKPVVNKALAVGALVAVTGVAFVIAFTFFRKGGYSEDDSYLVRVYFRDATGLTWKSRVQIAGIQIGEVGEIGLEGARARLDLRIRNEVPLHADACIYKTFPSALLPDAVLDVAPGSEGKPLLRDLPENQREVTCVKEATTVQQLVDAMSQIAADVQKVTGDLALTVGGEKGSVRDIVESLATITRRVEATVAESEGRLQSILANTDRFTSDLADISSGERERVHAIARNLEQVSEQLKRVLGGVEELVGTGPGTAPGAAPGAAPGGGGEPAPGTGPSRPRTPAEEQERQLAAQQAGLRQAVERLNTTLGRVDNIVAKVEEGKGVAGKLITDERTGRQLGSAIEGVADYLDRLTKIQVEVNLRSEWLFNQRGGKAYFGARLLPRPDKAYIVEVVADPRGFDTPVTETITTVDRTDPANPIVSEVTTERLTHEEKLRFSLQFAKRYGDVTFRVGVIESSGGLGADLHLFDDRLRLSTSIYEFESEYVDYPRVKLWVDYRFLQHFYLTAGADDFLNRYQDIRSGAGRSFSIGNDVFFGAGIFFTDDDLKAFIAGGGASAAGGM